MSGQAIVDAKEMSRGSELLFLAGCNRNRSIRKMMDEKTILQQRVPVLCLPMQKGRLGRENTIRKLAQNWKNMGIQKILLENQSLMLAQPVLQDFFSLYQGTPLLWECRALFLLRYCKFIHCSPYQPCVTILAEKPSVQLEQLMEQMSRYVREIRFPICSREGLLPLKENMLYEYGINVIFSEIRNDRLVLNLSEERSFVKQALARYDGPLLSLSQLKLERRGFYNQVILQAKDTGERIDLAQLSFLLDADQSSNALEWIAKKQLKVVSFVNIF